MEQENIQSIKSHLANQFNLPDDQIEMMLPSFIETLGTHLEKLENAMKENDPVLLGKTGHTIKGAFLNLGLKNCAEIALTIEKKGKAGDQNENYQQLVEELRRKVSPVLG